jgi:beta-xylosidase
MARGRTLCARTRWTAAAASLALLLGGVAVAPALARESGRPDVRTAVPRSLPVRGPAATHDPSMIRARDGSYYVFSTHNGIEIRHSSQPSDDYNAIDPAPDAVEGAVIHRHGRYYYLFASYDFCCRGLDSTYRIKVGRSRSITGPYVDEAGRSLMEDGGTTILATHGDEIGPGGQSVLRDRHRDLLVFHYYDRADAVTPRLGIDVLGWRHGWPVAPRNGGGRGR